LKFRPQKPSILDESEESLRAFIESNGFPRFRVQQILDWVYKKAVSKFSEMKNIPAGLREKLESSYTLNPVDPVLWKQSGDDTHKLLSKLEDGSFIETVLIQAPMVGVGAGEVPGDCLCFESGRLRLWL